jgi:outer membrane protein insertion porin family
MDLRVKAVFIILFFIAVGASAQINIGAAESPIVLEGDYNKPMVYEIGGITTSGTKSLDPSTLIALTGIKVGDQITLPGERINKAVKKLWEQGILSDIKVYATKVEGKYLFINFQLTEKPRLSKFSFSGISKGQADDLREKISLVRGRVVNDALVRNTENTIKKFFDEKGFRNAKVTIAQEEDPSLKGSVLLKINVKRGDKIKIKPLNFEGNLSYTDEQLRRKFKETKEKRSWRVFKSSKFRRKEYEEDKEKLIAFYNSQGFRDAAIVQDSIYDVDKKSIGLTIRIEEGKKYYFRKIDWTGNFLYEEKYLSQVLGIKRGDVYNLENLEKRLNYNPSGADVTSLYMDDGYLFFSIEPVEVLVDGDSIDLEMRVYEGSQATINRIKIAGNDKTNDHVILREIRTLPGQKFNRSLLIRTNRELATLGYFDPEQIGMNPRPNYNDGTVDIDYSLVERPSDQIELSGGWGGFFGFVGTLGLTFNNFSTKNILKKWDPLPSGDGQRLQLRGQANGRQFQSYSFSFTEPWIGGKKPHSFTISFNHSIQRRLERFGGRQLGKLGISGITLTLGRRLKVPDDFFILTNSLSFLIYQLDNFGQFGALNVTKGTLNNVFFNTTVSRNSLSDPIYPRTGSNVSLSLSLTPPYSVWSRLSTSEDPAERFRWIEYYKVMFDNSWFMKLAGKLVLNARSHFGFLNSYSATLGAPPFERFSMGGDGLAGFNFLLGTDVIGLRGYQNASINPVETFAGTSSRVRSNGTAFTKHVMELRYPLSLNPSATIFMLTFLEGGNNWLSSQEFSPFRIYKSAGVGARIFMPAFGLIGFDWGYGFDPLVPGGERSGSNFHFIIGQQIR